MFKSGLIKKVTSHVAILVVLSVLLGCTNALAAGHRRIGGCTVSSTQWVNIPLSSTETGAFQLTFNATPSASSIDGVVGLSSGPATNFTNLAAVVRFNSAGDIDARSGANYTAASAIPYSAGVSYQFILNVNVPAHTYNAYVVIGGVQTTIGLNLAFRSEQAAVTSLNDIGSMDSPGSEMICNVELSSVASAPAAPVAPASVAPAISTQPASQTVTAGQTATFTVATTGTAPMTYQWQMNGANMSGATSSSYTTTATTTANSGSKFNVIVSNAAGTATSGAATLTVNAAAVAPTITMQPASQTLTAGQSATFTVAASGTSLMTYQWQKSGANIAGATSSSYTVTGTTTAISGSTFDVVVSNAAGTTTSASATLTVNAAVVAPAVTSQPASQSVLAGQTATFSVACSGTSPMTYQWQKNGASISGATSSTYTTPATTSANSGSTFSVVVSNAAGTATSNSASLTVTAASLVLNASPASVSFGNVTLSTSTTQTITLTNAGNSTVTISNVTISGAGFNGSGGNGAILTAGQSTTITASFDPSSAGSATGTLTVASNATNSPSTIALTGTGVAPVSHSVSLSWQPSASTIVGYNVYSSSTATGTYTKLTTSPVSAVDYVDDSVQAGQTYYYAVTSVGTDNVESAYSNQVSALVP